jgi:hypothetical protein
MDPILFYIAGSSSALRFAADYLKEAGCSVTFLPSRDVTHTLLPVPYQGEPSLWDPAHLPENVTVLGGNLSRPELEKYQIVDLLKDEDYLAENAAITADCAIRIAARHLQIAFQGCPVLVLGWGRIGKCLARALTSSGANVTVAARKKCDRAMAKALGYGVTDFAGDLSHYRVIFNTVPAGVLPKERMCTCRQDCIKIDLASQKGIDDEDVIWARGLPGKMLPESSGRLIGQTVLRLIKEETL